jgi:RNA polymerase sigma-70 factor, ECF subfamily
LPLTLTADRIKHESAQNPSAWLEAAFNEHWSRVYAVLYRLVGDQAEAEDLALETFWRLYTRRPNLNNPHSLGGWLYRVAMNLGFNALRARLRRQQYESQAGLQTSPVESGWDPAEQVEKAQEILQVRRALLRLKPRSAQLLILRHSGLSYAELAETLEIAPGSIGTLLVRAEREFEAVFRALEGEPHAPQRRSD